MKELGKSRETVIIEFTRAEADALKMLQDATHGLGWDCFQSGLGYHLDEKNMHPIFIAVTKFAKSKFYINQLKRLMDELDRKIPGDK